jgi:signal recognition particle receptor subunit beta
VVDSSDPARLQEARLELHKILSDDAVKRTLTSVLVYANKQDMSNAMSPAMMVQELGLNNLHGVDWYCQASAATTGAGLYEGLEWLNGSLTGAPANKRKGARGALGAGGMASMVGGI